MLGRNVVLWNAMITGYAQNMKLDEARDLFEKMPERNLSSWNAMITVFIQNGELRRAEKLFDKMPWKNVVSWTTMITGYVQSEQSEEALKIFSKMLEEDGVKPNEITFVLNRMMYVALFSACFHSSMVKEGLSRAGKLNEALEFIMRLGTTPSVSVWKALLAGCHFHRDVNLGKVVAKWILDVEPENAGTCLLLSNICFMRKMEGRL
ncbi:hypothetical protein DITRI_Ditri06bG0006300 [Diplodiscus trichospermus]